MPPITCSFVINSADGGDLAGNMFGAVTPRVKKNLPNGPSDELFVEVAWAVPAPAAGLPAPPAPARLLGRFMFSKAPTALATQVDAPPFRTVPVPPAAGRQICFQEDVAPLANGIYKFGPYKVDANASLGRYEMTFVAEDQTTNKQWSEDPEFDVDG